MAAHRAPEVPPRPGGRPPLPTVLKVVTAWDETIRATGIDPIAVSYEINGLLVEIHELEMTAFGHAVPHTPPSEEKRSEQ